MKLLQILPVTMLVLIIPSCMGSPEIPYTPTQKSAAPTYVDIPTRSSMPTIPPAPTNISPSPTSDQSTPPPWVAEFAEPILESAADQYTAFQDDFTAQLNHGWFYLV